MSSQKTKKTDLSRQIMQVIKKKRIKMRPKIYFVLGSILLGAGLAGVVLFSAFFVNLILFALINHRSLVFLFLAPKLGVRPFLITFPWLALMLSLAGVVLGSSLLKKYDISYRKSLWLLILILVVTIFTLGLLMNKTRLNPRLKELKHLRRFYHMPYSPPPFAPERRQTSF